MNAYLQIFRLFFTSLGLVKWLAIIFLIAYIPLIILDRSEEVYGLAILSFFFVLGTPFMVAATSFRVLLANRHFSLLPEFHLKLGISLFVFTSIVALAPILHIVFVNSVEFVPCIVSVRIFVFASFIIYFTQLMVSTLIHPKYFGNTLVIIYFAWIGLDIPIPEIIKNDLVSIIAFLFCITVWVFALYSLHQKGIYKIHNSVSKQVGFGGGNTTKFGQTKDQWDWLQAFFGASGLFHRGTIMRGHLDNLKSRFFRIVGVIFFAPILFIIVIWFGGFEMKVDGAVGNNFITLFTGIMALGAIGIVTIILPLNATEWLARVRYLWLRTPENRLQLWHYVEKEIFLEVLMAYATAFILGGLIFIFSNLSWVLYINFVALIISGSLYLSYCAIYCKINKWDFIYCIFSYVFGATLLVIAFFTFLDKHYAVYALIQLALVIVGLRFRKDCIKTFSKMDWSYIKPARRVGGRSQVG